MFGKKSMNSTGRFIMDAGRKAGNLPAPATKSMKPQGTATTGVSQAASRHAKPKQAPTVSVAKGAAAMKPARPVASLAPRTINRSQVRFPATKMAGKFAHVQGGRKGT